MKRIFKPITALATGLVLMLAACRKPNDIVQSPVPPPGKTTNQFQFVIDSFPGESLTGTTNVFAVVTLVNEQGTVVINAKKLSLNFTGKYYAEKLQLPGGNYKLTQFMIVNGNNITSFAAPIANSIKAALVTRPLSISIDIPNSNMLTVPVQVLKVESGENAESYGYTRGSFNLPPATPGEPLPGQLYYTVKVKASVKIGAIDYDSIPASLRLTTWDANNERSLSFISLKPGTNEVKLPVGVSKYQLTLEKWGITDEVTLMKADVKEGMELVLGGSKAAKKLTSEVTLNLVEGVYKAYSKTSYEYRADGNINKIIYYLKKADNTPYISMTEEFIYNNQRLEKINKYNESKNLVGYISFNYDQEGRVSAMDHSMNGEQTIASVSYSNVQNRQEINVNYRYPGKTIDMNYYMVLADGNMQEGTAATSNHSSELSKYYYDININPYAHMNWPDLFLSHSSKNNVAASQQSFFASYPVSVPRSYAYTYDNEGYPKELTREYKSPVTNQYLYTTKTVYYY
jgi:hypothetical protein